MQLSPHFSLAELEVTSTGLDNSTPPDLIPRLADLCAQVLEPIRAHFGPVRVNSGYRSPAVNAAVGGAPTSQHTQAAAADIEVDGVPNLTLARWVRDNLQFDQLILEAWRPDRAGAGWVHVSWVGHRPLRQSVLTMQLGPHGPIYSAGLPKE